MRKQIERYGPFAVDQCKLRAKTADSLPPPALPPRLLVRFQLTVGSRLFLDRQIKTCMSPEAEPAVWFSISFKSDIPHFTSLGRSHYWLCSRIWSLTCGACSTMSYNFYFGKPQC